MKNKISALMDGELDNVDITDTIAQIKKTEDLRNEWATYHLIGDTLRQSVAAPIDIASQVSKRLAVEPTVLAPHVPTEHKGKVFAFSVAASMVTAVAAVVWMSVQTMDRPLKSITDNSVHQAAVKAEPTVIPVSVPALAQMEPVTDKSVLQAAVKAEPTVISAPIPAPAHINDYYLLVHGEFSPRTAMHGVAPYIRTVTDSDERSTK
ncbi:MAG: sigma-E factor negative regulatory protein [Nitrosomonadaceae bacterium]